MVFTAETDARRALRCRDAADQLAFRVIYIYIPVRDVYAPFLIDGRGKLPSFGEIGQPGKSTFRTHLQPYGTLVIFIRNVEGFTRVGGGQGRGPGQVIDDRDDGGSVRRDPALFGLTDDYRIEIMIIPPAVGRIHGLVYLSDTPHRGLRQ